MMETFDKSRVSFVSVTQQCRWCANAPGQLLSGDADGCECSLW